jgi:uncharacterized lipoprotein YbaY
MASSAAWPISAAALAFTVFAIAPAEAACRFNSWVRVEGPARTRLPPAARLELTIFDGNLADAPMAMSTVGALTVPVGGRRFPIVQRMRVRSERRCPVQPTLSARIKAGERLIFINDVRTEAVPGGRTEVRLKPVGS